MKNRLPSIQEATHSYQEWLSHEISLLPPDLELKHQRMAAECFPFLRATYYRWAQLWPEICADLLRAPEVLAVGDLHVENFGTWRDAEGRLVWGINDFDEATPLPYTQDLVRLATSARLAVEACDFQIEPKAAEKAILSGYRECLEEGGRPYVLAEHRSALRDMATHRLRDPQVFWQKLEALPTYPADLPRGAIKALDLFMPQDGLSRRIAHRIAGLGSLGRQRFVAIAEWQGSKIAREAKALAPSAAVWAHGSKHETHILYQAILDSSIRCADPFVRVKRRWIVRRLAPDCSHILMNELGDQRDAVRLLHAMGWETGNVHLGSRTAHALLLDLASREDRWLRRSADAMLEAVRADWQQWRDDPAPRPRHKQTAKVKKESKDVGKAAAKTIGKTAAKTGKAAGKPAGKTTSKATTSRKRSAVQPKNPAARRG
jgi:hypothetical protein